MYDIYNGIIGDVMKNDSVKGIIQLVLSVLVYYILENYFFFLLGKIGIHLSGDIYNYACFGRYVLICVIIYIIYRSNLHSSKSKFTKSFITSAIFSVGTCVLMVFVNYLLHKVVGTFHPVNGYGFTNYFNDSFSISYALGLITDIILKPFLVVVIFSLGVSNILKHTSTASIVSGLLYGVVMMLGLNCSIDQAFWIILIPSLIVMLVTYLYKSTGNIWMVYIAYALYVGCGFHVLRYFV